MTIPSRRFTCIGTLSACTLLASLAGCHSEANSGNPAAPISIGNQVDDSVVTTKVMSALMSDDDIKSLDIKVRTRKGEVMLSGFVDNQTQMDRSIALVKRVEGVSSVDNQLSLKEGKQTVGNKIDDSVITTQVKSALLSDPAMSSHDISVITRKGEVQLSGFVDSPIQLKQAMDLAQGVQGVSSVSNHMSIKK